MLGELSLSMGLTPHAMQLVSELAAVATQEPDASGLVWIDAQVLERIVCDGLATPAGLAKDCDAPVERVPVGGL